MWVWSCLEGYLWDSSCVCAVTIKLILFKNILGLIFRMHQNLLNLRGLLRLVQTIFFYKYYVTFHLNKMSTKPTQHPYKILTKSIQHSILLKWYHKNYCVSFINRSKKSKLLDDCALCCALINENIFCCLRTNNYIWDMYFVQYL